MTEIKCKPFLKWAGGKTKLLPELLKRVPENFDTYHEPFVGGGALFFALQPKKAVLSDANDKLIRTYKAVESEHVTVFDVFELLASNHSKEFYYKVRKEFQEDVPDTLLAARFVYLNKTCFNGLYRVNKAGAFNVPIGDAIKPALNYHDFHSCVVALRSATILHKSEYQSDKRNGNNFYYFDPPYHKCFCAYADHGFTEQDQRELKWRMVTLSTYGNKVMQSNSDTPFIRELYKDFYIEEVSANRSIAADGGKRGKVGELIIRNYQ